MRGGGQGPVKWLVTFPRCEGKVARKGLSKKETSSQSTAAVSEPQGHRRRH